MKKILSIAMAIVLILGLAACTKQESDGKVTKPIEKTSVVNFDKIPGMAKLREAMEKGEIPKECYVLFDAMGSRPRVKLTDKEQIEKVYNLLAEMKVVAETNVSITDAYHNVTFVLQDGTEVAVSFETADILAVTYLEHYEVNDGGALWKYVKELQDNMKDSSGAFKLASLNLPVSVKAPNYDDFVDKNGNIDDAKMEKAYEEYDKYLQDKIALKEAYTKITGSSGTKLDKYFKNAAAFLNTEDGKNSVVSPINIYFALAMLCETTDSQTRTQIMDVLGVSDLEELRTIAKALWEVNYWDNDEITTKLGASLWMNDEIDFNEETIANLALYYYATSYKGSATDPDFNAAFKEWLDEQTGGLLKEQVGSLPDFTQDMVMTIATSIYFRGTWQDEFDEYNTNQDTFHAVSGDLTADFMHAERHTRYEKGDGFAAVKLWFNGSSAMWIILPDEGVSPEKLYENDKLMNFILKAEAEDSDKEAQKVRLSLPKFDVDSTMSLVDALKSLGVKDAFDSTKADFKPLTDLDGVYVSDITHSARVKIDEKGCEAAAFTVIELNGSAMPVPEEPIEFNVDRPFTFVITGFDGLPMFNGIVNSVN